MKPYVVPYEEFKSLCLNLAEQARSFDPCIVVCIARGGMTASHIIAKALNLQVAFVASYDSYVTSMGLYSDFHKSALVVDDMVDQGRTITKLQAYLSDTYPSIAFKYAAVYQVGEFSLDFIGEKVQDRWLVMPNEESCKVIVGDKNLFSEGNSKYGTN